MVKQDNQEKILVIKLSALGDFIQALGPMAAIRKAHKDAHITLMTTEPFREFGQKCGYFNSVMVDERPGFKDILGWFTLRKKLLEGNFIRVYDLQNNDRSCLYFKLLPTNKKPEWVGIAKGASHRNTSPGRTAGHAIDGHRQTLGLAGVTGIEVDTLEWVEEDLSDFPINEPYVLFAAGSSPQHSYKRWDAEKYGQLAKKVSRLGYQVILLGTETEKDLAEIITGICPEVLDLTAKTSLFQVAMLAQKATAAVGNDTGPMHMIGPTRCPSLVLFSGFSNPDRHAPKGENVHIQQKHHLEDLEIDTVYKKFREILDTKDTRG